MDFCGLSKDFLADCEKYLSYDENIPLQYRVFAKLIGDIDYEMARKFIDANRAEFDNEYNYLLLDLAIEMSINFVVDEFGKLHSSLFLNEHQLYKPFPETLKFIEYLLENGADPSFPKHFNQLDHINDLEEDCSNQCLCEFDCSEVKELLKSYM